MSDKLFLIEMMFFFIILFNGICVGYTVISSYIENYPKIEYASTTNEKFYQEMVKMDKNTTRFFNGFPTCLTGILSHQSKPGDKILTTEKDTLYLVDWNLNRTDINKYPYYVLKDNHGEIWTLFRHNDKFRLTKKDEKQYKKWLKELGK